MRLKLTRHFQDMIQYRGIELGDVKKALNSPDSLENAYEGALKATKRVGGKEIQVIYCKENFKDKKAEYLVITAYYL